MTPQQLVQSIPVCACACVDINAHESLTSPLHRWLVLQECAALPDNHPYKAYGQRAAMLRNMIRSVITNCGLPAGSGPPAACFDNDEQVKMDSDGAVQNCAAMTSFSSNGTVNLCKDESPVTKMGAPPGWVHSRCPVTCGLCNATAPVQCPASHDDANEESKCGTVSGTVEGGVCDGMRFSKKLCGGTNHPSVFGGTVSTCHVVVGLLCCESPLILVARHVRWRIGSASLCAGVHVCRERRSAQTR